MSSNQTARSRPSNDILTAIFNAALDDYQRVTGQRLENDPSAVELAACNSPEDILSFLQAQAKAVVGFRKAPFERLMAQLHPIVNVLFTLSTALGNVAGLVSRIRRSFGMTIPQHLVRRHSRSSTQSLLVSEFFSLYVISQNFCHESE